MVSDIFKGMIGVYAPNALESVKDHVVKTIGGLTPKTIFDDGSWVITYGGEIVDYSTRRDEKQPEPEEAYFMGMSGRY